MAISFDRDAVVDRKHREADAPGVCLQRRGRREIVDECGHQEPLRILNRPGKTDLGERAADERVQSRETAMEHAAGAPGDSNVPRLEHLERNHRGVDQVPQFMSQEPEALGPAVRLRRRCRTDFVRARTR